MIIPNGILLSLMKNIAGNIPGTAGQGQACAGSDVLQGQDFVSMLKQWLSAGTQGGQQDAQAVESLVQKLQTESGSSLSPQLLALLASLVQTQIANPTVNPGNLPEALASALNTQGEQGQESSSVKPVSMQQLIENLNASAAQPLVTSENLAQASAGLTEEQKQTLAQLQALFTQKSSQLDNGDVLKLLAALGEESKVSAGNDTAGTVMPSAQTAVNEPEIHAAVPNGDTQNTEMLQTNQVSPEAATSVAPATGEKKEVSPVSGNALDPGILAESLMSSMGSKNLMSPEDISGLQVASTGLGYALNPEVVSESQVAPAAAADDSGKETVMPSQHPSLDNFIWSLQSAQEGHPLFEKLAQVFSKKQSDNPDSGFDLATLTRTLSLDQKTVSDPVSNTAFKDVKPNVPTEVPQHVDIANQLIQSMHTSIKNGSHQAYVELKPEYLGRALMKIQVENGHVNIRIDVNNNVVKQALESNFSSLRDSLTEKGLVMDKFNVNVNSNAAGNNLHQQQLEQQWVPSSQGSEYHFSFDEVEPAELVGVSSENYAIDTGSINYLV